MGSRLGRWFRRFVRLTVGLIAVMVAAWLVLHYGFGLRMVQLGGGRPTLTFKNPDAHDAELQRHRAAQRANAPPPTAASPVAVATPVSAAAPAATPAPLAKAETATPGAVETTAKMTARASSGSAAAGAAAYWTDFRGPARDGRYEQGPILTDWPPNGLKPIWKQPIGLGYASFVVADGRLFTIERRRTREIVASYDAETGRELWTHDWSPAHAEGINDGPRATPVWHDGRVYALGVGGDLYALDARTGTVVWQRNILSDNGAQNLTYGMAASPLVVDDKLIVLPGGSDGRSVVAYQKDTGTRVWSALTDRQAYTAPLLATLAGTRQIVIVTGERAVGLTVAEGRLLWEYPWVTDYDVNASQPIVIGDNRLFLSAAYGHGAAVIELTPGGDRFNVRTVWQNTRMKNKFTSSVLHDGYIYGLDEAILACVDAATGTLQWKGGRYGYGQVILASGHLIVITEDGDLALVRATPASHQEVVRFSAIDGKTWNHPALADGRLFVRNGDEMAAFDLRRQP